MQRVLSLFLILSLVACSSSKPKPGQSAGSRYFESVRKQIGPAWASELRAHREQIPTRGDLTTGVEVRVAADGSVKKVMVTSQSASKVLDTLAITTLVKSSPWPPPPITMLKGGFASFKWELSAFGPKKSK